MNWNELTKSDKSVFLWNDGSAFLYVFKAAIFENIHSPKQLKLLDAVHFD